MNITVHKMSYYAEAILKSAHDGMVHSVYRKTVNLNIKNRIIALQADGSHLSPLSLITASSSSDMETLMLKKGDPVTISEDQIVICSSSSVHHVSCNNADRYDLLLSGSLDTDACTELSRNIKAALSQTSAGGFEMIFSEKSNEELSLLLLAAKKYISDSFLLYKNKKYGESATALLKVLGLGSGLTPGGDDFLCGVLAGLRLSGQENSCFSVALKSEIPKRLSDTIDISAAFLSCALEGQYSMAVNSLVSVPGPGEIFSSFSEIGHSSGMDTLCGVLYALTLKNMS